jgi:short-subunit dehydrogenase
MKPVTLITGASAGVGADLARVFAAHGHELVLIAQRQERRVADQSLTKRPRSTPAALTP